MGGLVSGDGWAIIDGNEQLDMRTVTDTRRGAIVNWLWARRGFRITNEWSDERIYESWDAVKGDHNVARVRVVVSGA